ncbi:hypothetical protein SCD_n00415 [Sulfuricella denitrificans skB26]|uniref:Filamentous haemagglutinin FhaB/tRNA nuclease CdiA-like TPS domain-containing protein n=1 Tax=Sulfuricella denitrificans (strain DSM 22764 / NBRC 105220 / skB26) TaxID=1163617 RepID=S6AIC8_SULDS|nr:nidogen-like domain-containing protein [Sulfuricella denitrificans]BAN34264.1 hypothetical protein SCD_n00415 [Sulfuricella denitrificans skB26]
MALCTKLLVIGQIVLSSIGFAVASPTGGTVTDGSGTISQAGSATNINQVSQRLDINWQTFSTQTHESVNFIQPNATALAINRVIGGVPSELRGALNANGRVFVLNESGITFYGSSQVNVGALLATTARDVTVDGDHFSFSGGGYGQVANHGDIHVSNGGFAVLAAPYVENTGTIQANLGQIQLASVKDYTVDLRGDGLINFTVPKQAVEAIASAGDKLGVDNSGTLRAQSGIINISANLAHDIVQSVVNLGGVVDASAYSTGLNGGVVLVTSVGDMHITGEIYADGGVDGNGGSVRTWADGTNYFELGAIITARGGTSAGDGGFIELSGNQLSYRGVAVVSAANGFEGILLIDPVTNIPQSFLIPSTTYYTDLIGGGIGSPLVMTGGGSSANVGFSRNDDGYSGPIPLGFSLLFYGTVYTQFWANNNGNISFNGGISSYTPFGPQGAPQPVISPFFADVDTRNGTSGLMTLRNDIPNQIIVTWDRVGYYSSQADKLNSFQLVVRGPGYSIPAGEGAIGFFYKTMQWETGGASGGSGGFGGTPAAVGFGDGNANGIVLVGSIENGISGVLNNHHIWFGANLVPVGEAPVVAATCAQCEVHNALEARRVEPLEPRPTGREPLRIAQDGLVLWATGAGVTVPSFGGIVTANAASAIAAGADPTTLLPATAAGGLGLSAGLDAYSIGGTDYCDQVVSGYCLPQAGEKAKQ